MKKRTTPTTPSRRRFLAGSAALGGGLMGACSSTGSSVANAPIPAFAPRPQVADGEPVRIGVIGTGGMGRGHIGSIVGLAERGRENVQVVAVCDVCQTHLDAAHKVATQDGEGNPRQVGIEVTKYRYYPELLARDDIHGVLIAAPEHWHAKMAVDALAAGKDVYCEKPMTLRLPEALHLRRVAQASDNLVQVGTQMMQLPKYGAARRLIKEGAIGKPVWSQTSYCRNSRDGEWTYYGIDEAVQPGEVLDWEAWCGPLGSRPFDTNVFHRWRRYKDYSTGIVGDLLVHVMTPLVYALDAGWPTRVVATGGHYVDKAMENHDQVNLQVQFESDQTMVIAGSTANEQGLETMIRGHEATLYLGGNHCRVVPEKIYVDEVDPLEEKFEGMPDDQDQHRLNWLACIRTREQPFGDVDTATKIMVMVDLATRSMWENRAFAFDPDALEVVRA